MHAQKIASGPDDPMKLEVLFAPAEFAALAGRDLARTLCVVFDVLRATSSMVTALANGAESILPVAEIPEALALRRGDPELLLAGERDGVRILANLTGDVDFDLGNSPREFTRARIGGRRIAMTTTNGTRALRACAHARRVVLGSFLNLSATVDFIRQQSPRELLLVCSGTLDQAAYEDVLGAGALCARLWAESPPEHAADSALLARRVFLSEQADLFAAVAQSRNAARLLRQPELADDVRFCLQQDAFELVAILDQDQVKSLQP
jgi:2-phosphosulfolactate phosphatase